MKRFLFLLCGLLSAAACQCLQTPEIVRVSATVETDPVPHSGDAADDPALWIHPEDPSLSVVIGTDKQGGLAVYGLDGMQKSYSSDAKMNNVDVRYGLSLAGEAVDVIAASNRTANAIALYTIDAETYLLENIAARAIFVDVEEIYGLCMYRSAVSGEMYVFVSGKDDGIEQWRLFDDGKGRVDAEQVRAFEVGSEVEGCVADDETGYLFLGEEKTGIWKYGAEPDDGTERVRVDRATLCGELRADVEGLALYYGRDGAGYLIASSQGNDTFVLYDREPPHSRIGVFALVDNDSGSIDGAYHTDGIEVVSCSLGEGFSRGVFIAHDGRNEMPDAHQNYKLVPWERIAEGFGLLSEEENRLQ